MAIMFHSVNMVQIRIAHHKCNRFVNICPELRYFEVGSLCLLSSPVPFVKVRTKQCLYVGVRYVLGLRVFSIMLGGSTPLLVQFDNLILQEKK